MVIRNPDDDNGSSHDDSLSDRFTTLLAAFFLHAAEPVAPAKPGAYYGARTTDYPALVQVQLGVNYAPGIVLFDSTGKEAIRWESSFRVFHTLGMFDYIVTGEYRREPSFQRFLSAKAEHLRETGRDVNIWRYADEPVAATAR